MFFNCFRSKLPTFDALDADKDGRISLSEFRNYMIRKCGRPPKFEEWIKFHLCDKDNNGYITRNDVEKFNNTVKFIE